VRAHREEDVRRDKPVARLGTTITNQDRVIVLDGSTLVYTEELHTDS